MLHRVIFAFLTLFFSFLLSLSHLVTQLVVCSDAVDACLPYLELEQLIEVKLSIEIGIHDFEEVLRSFDIDLLPVSRLCLLILAVLFD